MGLLNLYIYILEHGLREGEIFEVLCGFTLGIFSSIEESLRGSRERTLFLPIFFSCSTRL